MLVKNALEKASLLLSDYGFDNLELDIEILLSEVLGIKKYELFIQRDKILSNSQIKLFFSYIDRRKNYEPVQYILGFTEFYGYKFFVGKGVLIPRLETEIMVSYTVDYVKDKFVKDDEIHILDLCCGSGCIILSLYQELIKIGYKHIYLEATDISEQAISYAKKNSLHLNTKVNFLKSDLFNEISNRYNIILTNPPYISYSFLDKIHDEVKKYEPENALFTSDDGLHIIKKIAKKSKDFLFDEGLIICEISHEQEDKVKSYFDYYVNTKIIPDYNKLSRFIACQK